MKTAIIRQKIAKVAIVTVAVVIASTMVSCHSGKHLANSKRSIVVLYENDVHCAIDGYATLAGLRDAIRDTADVLLVSSGDYIQGNVAGTLSKGELPVKIMESVGYDVITLGNHEFDFAIPHQITLTDRLKGKVVCANLVEMPSGKNVYPPYIIKNVGGKKIAFIGVVTPSSMRSDRFAFYKEDGEQIYSLQPDKVYSLIQKYADEARKKGADYVIVMSHLGEDETEENVDSHGLIANTKGIDIVLDAHTHRTIPHDTVINAAGKKTVVTQTGSELKNIGKLLISRDGKMSVDLLPSKSISQRNSTVSRITDEVKAEIEKAANKKVGHSNSVLRLLDENGDYLVRYEETNAGDLVADAFRFMTKSEIAITNGGGLRNELEAGDLTYGDFMKLLPYDNNVVVVEVKGSTIIELLTKCTEKMYKDNGDFPQCSGLRYTINLNEHTVSDVMVESNDGLVPIDPDRTYRMATIDYCIAGGGFKRILANCPVIAKDDINYRDVVIDYVSGHLNGIIGDQYRQPQGRITIK